MFIGESIYYLKSNRDPLSLDGAGIEHPRLIKFMFVHIFLYCYITFPLSYFISYRYREKSLYLYQIATRLYIVIYRYVKIVRN